MGLLDQAIREHLELKRRRGGDPSAIAREEREALAPGLADEPADERAHIAGEEPLDSEVSSPSTAMPIASPAWDEHNPEDRVTGLPAGGQETAELDMQAVMEDHPDAADPGAPLAPQVDEPALAGDGGDASQDDSLEWEYPNETPCVNLWWRGVR